MSKNYNQTIQSNNTDLQAILNTINELPEASSGGDTSIEILKAFESTPQPTNNDLMYKALVPIVEPSYVSNYTNSSSTISTSFVCGDVGNTHVLALAVRNPASEPVAPSGWSKVAWIAPHNNSTSNQWLFIAKYKVDENSAGTTKSVSFNVTNGQRNYLMVINIGDYDIEDEYISSVYSGVTDIVCEIYENTLIICSSEISSTDRSSMWNVNDGYAYNMKPAYSDGNNLNGNRLCALYIPFLSQQPFVNNQININVFSNVETTDGAITCALKLKLGTPTKYFASMGIQM